MNVYPSTYEAWRIMFATPVPVISPESSFLKLKLVLFITSEIEARALAPLAGSADLL